MKSHLRNVAIALAVLGNGSLAAAQMSSAPDATRGFQLTPQQRERIHQTVMSDRAQKITTPPPANVPTSVGAEIPASTALYDFPAPILVEIEREGVVYARAYDIRGRSFTSLFTIPPVE